MQAIVFFLYLTNILPMQKEFPFEKLKVKEVFYVFTQEIEDEQDAEIELIVEFEPIKVEDEKLNLKLEFVGFSNPEMENRVFLDGYNFSDDDKIEPSSIYLQSVHNPIDLKALKIERKQDIEIITIELYFDFEYERTDYQNRLLKVQFEKE